MDTRTLRNLDRRNRLPGAAHARTEEARPATPHRVSALAYVIGGGVEPPSGGPGTRATAGANGIVAASIASSCAPASMDRGSAKARPGREAGDQARQRTGTAPPEQGETLPL